MKVLQFGEGNFLRAFVDYFIDVMNEKAGFNGKVVLTQPIAPGLAPMINAQEGLYTLFLRGRENGEKVNRKRVISCVKSCNNPYEDFQGLLDQVKNPDLRFLVSNTTEAKNKGNHCQTSKNRLASFVLSRNKKSKNPHNQTKKSISQPPETSPKQLQNSRQPKHPSGNANQQNRFHPYTHPKCAYKACAVTRRAQKASPARGEISQHKSGSHAAPAFAYNEYSFIPARQTP